MLEPLPPTSRTRWLLLALLFGVFYVPFLLEHGRDHWRELTADFPTFYFAPRLAFTQGISPYDNQALAVIAQKLGQPIYAFLYPPSSLTLFYPVAFLSYPAAWHGLLVADHVTLLAMLWLLAFRFLPVGMPSSSAQASRADRLEQLNGDAGRTLTGEREQPNEGEEAEGGRELEARETVHFPVGMRGLEVTNALIAALTIVYVLSFHPIGVTFKEGQINLLALLGVVVAWERTRPGRRVRPEPDRQLEGSSQPLHPPQKLESARETMGAGQGGGAKVAAVSAGQGGSTEAAAVSAGQGGGAKVAAAATRQGGIRALVAGLGLALAILFKAYFALALGLLMITRRLRPIAWCLVFLGMASIFTWLLAPESIWQDWAVNVAPGGGYGRTPNYLFSPAAPWNQSLNGFFSRLYLTNPFNRPLWPDQTWLLEVQYAVAGLIFGGTLGLTWLTRRRGLENSTGSRALPDSLRSRDLPDSLRPGATATREMPWPPDTTFDLQFSLWLVSIFLLAPFSWEHHLVFILPAVLLALREAWLERRYPMLSVLVLAAGILAAKVPYDAPALGRGPWTLLISVKLYAVMALWLALAGLLARKRSAEPLQSHG